MKCLSEAAHAIVMGQRDEIIRELMAARRGIKDAEASEWRRVEETAMTLVDEALEMAQAPRPQMFEVCALLAAATKRDAMVARLSELLCSRIAAAVASAGAQLGLSEGGVHVH